MTLLLREMSAFTGNVVASRRVITKALTMALPLPCGLGTICAGVAKSSSSSAVMKPPSR